MAKSPYPKGTYARNKGTHTDKVPMCNCKKTPQKHHTVAIGLLIMLMVMMAFFHVAALDRITNLELDNQMQQHMAQDAKAKLDNLCTHFKTGCTERYRGR